MVEEIGAFARKFFADMFLADADPALRERTIEQALRSGGVPYTIIRNARLYPAGTPSTGKAELTEDDTVLTPMTRAA